MVSLERMSLWENFKRLVSPAYRRRKDAEMLEVMRRLVADPSLPCMVAGVVIPDGYGDPPQTDFTWRS